MTYTDWVQRGQWLAATCDMSLPFTQEEWTLPSGILCRSLDRGILEFNPPQFPAQTKDIILSSGVHGNETSPIELLDRLVRDIMAGRLELSHRLLVMIAHPTAINNQTRFIEENLNRLFQVKNEPRNLECDIANNLQDIVSNFYGRSTAVAPERWHLDLHCAIRKSQHYRFALSPFTDKPTRSASLFSFIQQANLDAVLLSNRPSSTFSWHSAEYFGAQALTIELGQVAPLGRNDLTQLDDFDRAMRLLVSEPQLVETKWDSDKTPVYRVNRTLIKQSSDFFFLFPTDVPNFTFFDEGEHIGGDGETQFYIEQGGEAIVFPNPDVAIGQRAVLLVKPTSIEEIL